jgi:NADH dehydrogenase
MADLGPGVVTVFGGSGFVGGQVVRALAQRDWRIRVAVRRPVTAIALQPLGNVGQIQFTRCDITDPEQVAAAMRGADAAVNLVGALHEAPGRSFQRVHVEGARNIAEAARAAGVERLVQVSAIGADANSPAAYARTKGEAEAVVRSLIPQAVILRPSIIFGAGDGFLNRFARMAGIAPALPLIGGGQTRFQPVHVGDVAEAVARGLERPDAAGRTFELGGPGIYSFEDILKLVMRETGRERMLAPLPFFAARAIGSLAQLTTLVGIAPVLTRDQVLMLERDNVVAAGADGLAALGVQPTGLEAIAPGYLWLYRRGGQFAERPAR